MLPASFYLDEDVVQLSQKLLGKVLVVRENGIARSGIITETEAYMGPEDKASHAYGNRKSKRTDIMYAAGGHAYVYLCYGIHRLFNVVTGPSEVPHAVLIRAIEPYDGLEFMLTQRKMNTLSARLSAGPGLLTQALGIDLKHNGSKLWETDANIYISENPDPEFYFEISRGPRIGIDYAAEWAQIPWRFWIKSNGWVSRRDKAKLYE